MCRELSEKEILDTVRDIRHEAPGIGAYKLYLMFKELYPDEMRGRDWFYGLMHESHLMLKPGKRRHTTSSNHPYRKYKNMIKGLKIFMLCLVALFVSQTSRAQWVVTDPGNLAQGIINATKNIVHTSSTASTMIQNFQETVKIYKQGKEYYDALKKVKNLVRDARKVQQTILLVGDITDIYVNSFERMLNDPYFTVEELSAIALGYTKLLEESAHLLNDLKSVVNENGLSMSDKDRMDIIDKCYSEMLQYRGLVQYYTNKNIGVSYLRAKKQNDVDRVMSLYGSPSERYW